MIIKIDIWMRTLNTLTGNECIGDIKCKDELRYWFA